MKLLLIGLTAISTAYGGGYDDIKRKLDWIEFEQQLNDRRREWEEERQQRRIEAEQEQRHNEIMDEIRRDRRDREWDY